MAGLQFFYSEIIAANEMVLNEETSKHVVQVLRMSNGAVLNITDGKGQLAKTIIIDDNRKKCKLKIESVQTIKPLQPEIAVAISLLKNTSRFEWFLEKATELGVNRIIPIICDRTSKSKFRRDRMTNILTSAMLQSQQCWLPILDEPIRFRECIDLNYYSQKLIAHCEHSNKQKLGTILKENHSKLIMIGPEGDFTHEEIETALTENFVAVSLGDTRLRTETSGIVAATLIRLCS